MRQERRRGSPVFVGRPDAERLQSRFVGGWLTVITKQGRIRDVIVVGGGISGLTAAWHLKKAGLDVCLVEDQPSVGGCARTERRDGFLLEKGPFNVIIRDPSFEALLDDLADEIKVVTASPAAKKRYICRRGRLHAVPTSPIALATTGLLSASARWRLLAGLISSRRAGDGEETIEQAAARRFGQEVADTIVSAAISGIFAGDIRRLSLEACFPGVARIDAEARSLIGYGISSALRASRKRKAHRRRWRGLVSLEGGLGALTSMLGERLGSELLSGCTVEEIEPFDGRFALSIHGENGPAHALPCRRLVTATSAHEAGRLLRPLVPEAADVAASIESASLVVMNLGYRKEQIGHPLEGFGFLVPQNEPEFPLMGVLWADSVFPHHAPDAHRLLRVFVGGARDPGAVDRSDEELLSTASEALRDLLQVSGEPVLVDVCRYREAIPQYHLGHVEKIERMRAAVSTQPGLYVIGNYLEGVSLNDCIRLATEVAGDIIRDSTRIFAAPAGRRDITESRLRAADAAGIAG